jgi:endonuclease/exonuclease/phosphatase family metal-dependent hydrolase
MALRLGAAARGARRADALSVAALRAAEEEWRGRPGGAAAWLLREGLALDGAHALQLAGAAAAGAAREEGAAELAPRARRAHAELFPGLLEQTGRASWSAESGAVAQAGARGGAELLRDGCEVRMSACSMWVSSRSCIVPLVNGPRRLLSRLDLCVCRRTKREGARVFSVRKLTPPERAGDLNALAVHFGEPVELRCSSGSFSERVLLVCPGRVGPVCLLDHVFVVGVDAAGSPRDTWALAPTTRFGNLVPIRAVACAQQGRSAALSGASPLCITLHDADLELEPAPLLVVDSSKPASPSSGGASVPVAAASPPRESRPARAHEPLGVSVLVYNAWMMPRFCGALSVLNALGMGCSPEKNARAEAIPDALCNALEQLDVEALPDVVVLCENFCDVSGPRLKAGLKRKLGMPFEMPVCGSGPFVQTRAVVNGGVTVLSRFPIVRAEERLYSSHDEWARDDGLANKGALYIRVAKHRRPFNVIATHLQAWEGVPQIKAREAQMLCVRRFAQALRIHPGEPLVFAGDLNVCRVRCPDQYARMCGILCATDSLEIAPEDLRLAQQLVTLQVKRKKAKYESYYSDNYTAIEPKLAEQIKEDLLRDDPRIKRIFSFNTLNNELAVGGLSADIACALLDYVLFSNLHQQPTSVRTTVLHEVRAEQPYRYNGRELRDLSDHFPVLARFSF